MVAFGEQLSGLEAGSSNQGCPYGSDDVGGSASWSRPLSLVVDKTASPEARRKRSVLLSRIVETEILPRLALARGVDTETLRAITTERDAEELVRLLLKQEAPSSVAFLTDLRKKGATAEGLYLGIVSEAARRLGIMWEEDRCDFTQVTISMGRLQQVVRALSPVFQLTPIPRPRAQRVLLLPAPGGQHTFGLVLLAEFFSRAGWNVAGGPAVGAQEVVDTVRSGWFDVVGFSIGAERQLESLVNCIQAVRRASCNRDVGIMIGGPLFLERPDLPARVGADGAAVDAASAVLTASGLLALRASDP
jgi:methanogenic corrinoid protein MtbC1